MSEWAIDTLVQTAKEDPLRLLDASNDIQLLASHYLNAPSETERATSRFNKIVLGENRPISHTATEAAGLLPDAILLGIPFVKGISKVIKNAKTINKFNKAEKAAFRKAGEIINKTPIPEEKLLSTDKSKILNEWKTSLPSKTSDANVEKYLNRNIAGINRNIVRANKKIDNLAESNKVIADLMRKEGLDPTVKVNVVDWLNKNATTARKAIGYDNFNKLYKSMYDSAVPTISTAKFKAYDILPAGNKEIADMIRKEGLDPTPYINNSIKIMGKQNKPDKKMVVLPSFMHFATGAAPKNVASAVRYPLIRAAAGFGNTATESNSSVTPALNAQEISQYNFNKTKESMELNPLADFLKSLIHIDYNDPALYNENEVTDFLIAAEANGILAQGTNSMLRDATPRQKVQLLNAIMNDKEWTKRASNAYKNYMGITDKHQRSKE